MKILARGEKLIVEELKQKLSLINIDITHIQDTDLPSIDLRVFDVIFDFTFDEQTDLLKYYANLTDKPVFVSAVKKQLAEAAYEYGNPVECVLIGINTIPTFINRPLAEISLLNVCQKEQMQAVMGSLQWDYKLVEDRVGMVTPRIIFMIMNEACYTLQEGTASMKDIDTSMKLGTNYPYGPFEWADKIGIKHVYQTLKAVYDDTKDERYKICPLLKTNYLKQTSFLS
jgi:3-hydroxybutyryl-CoA dehydrogenase